MSTHAHRVVLFRKSHRHTHTFPSNITRILAQTHHFGFLCGSICRCIQYCPSTLVLQGLTDYMLPSAARTSPECVAQLANRNAGPRYKAGCSGSAVINEAHKRGGQKSRTFFHRSTGFKVFRLSKMTHLLFEGHLHHYNWRDTHFFLQGLSFCSDPSSCQNI